MAWKAISWSPEREQVIYREWGQYFTAKHRLDVADLYYNRSLDINPNDSHALFYRSRCKRTIAQTEQALLDSKLALKEEPMQQPFNLEVCDNVYELNQFEKAKALLHNYSRKFRGEKVHAFNHRIDIVERDFSKSLGESLGHFILGNRQYLLKAHAKMLEMRRVDTRPLWKQLRDDQKCDVLSILEKEVETLSPREIARRIREFTVYNQIYLGRSWVDVLFLRALRVDPSLLLHQSQWSSKILEILTKAKYQVVLKFLKMLQCRAPLYYKKSVASPNKKMKLIMTESYLYRVQYQVHRNMLDMLKKMRLLKKTGQIQLLKEYVELVMGDYVVLKTKRVMPWKFEFIKEVYNLLGLAMLEDLLNTPTGLGALPAEERMVAYLKLNTETEDKPVPFEFGKRSTYTDVDATDFKSMKLRATEARLEKRIYFAEYPIEKAYLWHEIAVCNFGQYRLDKTCLIAERAIAEADKIDSKIWKILGIVMICKAHAVLRQIEKIHLALIAGMTIAQLLNDRRIISFFERGRLINRGAFIAKKKAEAKRQKSLSAAHSSTSVNK